MKGVRLLSHPPPDSSCRLFLICIHIIPRAITSPALRGRLTGEVSIDEGNKDYKNPQGECR